MVLIPNENLPAPDARSYDGVGCINLNLKN